MTGGIHPLSEQNTVTTLDLQGAVQGLDLQELMAILPALDSNDYSGTANLSVEASGTTAALKITSTVNYRGTRLGGYPVERVAANVDYSGGRLPNGSWQGSPLKTRLITSSWDFLSLSLKV